MNNKPRKKKTPALICSNCSAEMKTKYLIRVDFDTKKEVDIDFDKQGEVIINEGKAMPVAHFQATTRRSIVGWIKHICNEYGNFQEIQIINLTTECPEHKKYYEDLKKQDGQNTNTTG